MLELDFLGKLNHSSKSRILPGPISKAKVNKAIYKNSLPKQRWTEMLGRNSKQSWSMWMIAYIIRQWLR